MTAKRYCGGLTLRLTYRDRENDYRCFIAAPGAWTTIYVGSPAVLRHAVDSPEAFDDAAHAALSFAADEGREFVERLAAYTDSGWDIRRKP
jgi:hypothetical protein